MYWQSTYHNKRILINGLWLVFGVILGLGLIACAQSQGSGPGEVAGKAITHEDSVQLFFHNNPTYFSTGFDYPVGKPSAKGYYNAQGFGANNHLGDDWNGNGGGNTDMGHPVYSISEGVVTESVNFYGGWGNVTRVAHAIKGKWKIENGKLVKDSTSQENTMMVESLYAHSEKVMVKQGDAVARGQQIATIGTAEGKYLAHLHLEIRESVGLPLGAGYSTNTLGYLNPTKFIEGNRQLVK